MFGTFGFSYVGLIFLCCLFIPNIMYAKRLPIDQFKIRENRALLAFERTGQALCTVIPLIFKNFNIHKAGLWSLWLIAAFVLMLLYLICWARYFRGAHVSKDFLRPILGIPLPLATLPVAAVFMLSLYGKVVCLGISAVILGIGHIGITAQHWNAFKKS